MTAFRRNLKRALATAVVASTTAAFGPVPSRPALAQTLDIAGLRIGDRTGDPNTLGTAETGDTANPGDGARDSGTGSDTGSGSGNVSSETGLQNPDPTQSLAPRSMRPGDTASDGSAQTSLDLQAPATNEDASGPERVSPPKPKFDLFDGPENAPAGGVVAVGPVQRQNTVASVRDGRNATGSVARPAVRQGAVQPNVADVAAFLPRNPPLSPGVAGESLGADSQLRANRRVQPIGQLLRRSQDDPFAPVGLRVGTFVLYPELIQTLGASSNLDDTPNGASGVFSETTISSRLLSDWSSNEAEFNTSLTYRRNFAGDTADDPSATADGRVRLDIDRLTTATFRGAIDYRRDQPGDVNDAFTGAKTRPEVLDLSGSGALAREFGRLTVTGTGTLARQSYSNLPDGALDQNLTTLTASLRTGYDLSPALAPFVEASLGRRIFDVGRTEGGDSIERNSLVPSARLGVSLNLAEKLVGEVAAGYAVNLPDDDNVGSHGAPTLDASLVWSPRRGTDVTVAARSSFSPQSDGRSTTVDYEGSIGLRHALTARTDLTATLTGLYGDSDQLSSDEFLLTAGVGFNYWLSRYAAVTGLYTHRQNYAQRAGEDYISDTIQFGLRLQR